MDAGKAKRLLVDYVNGYLPPAEREQIEQLLEDDDGLRAEAEALRQEMSLLRGAVADPSEEPRLRQISTNVMNELRRRRANSVEGLPPHWRSYLRAAAVYLLFVLAVILFFLLHPGPPQGRADEPEAPARHSEPEP